MRLFTRSALLGGVLAALAAITPLRAQEAASFNIAGVLAFSGAYGIIGKDMRQGVELAIEDRGSKVLGKPIQVTWEDDETKPQPAVQKATRLLAGGAQMIFGAVGSGSTLALQALADQRKVPLLVTISADDKITRKGGSRYTFRTSNTLGMEMRMSLEFARIKGLKRIYGVAADYQATRDAWESFAVEAEKAGITVVGADFPPLGNRDYSIIVDKIAKTDADGVAIVLTGNDAVTFLKQSGQVGLGKSKVQFGPVLQDETLAAAVGPDSIGTYSGVRYHFTQDNPVNKDFVARYKAKFGELPSSFAGEAYDGMSWWLDVVDSTGSWDKEKWVDAFANSKRLNSLEGVKTMRACDHQAAQVGLWGVVKEGKAPLPPLTLDIVNIFPPEKLFDPC